MDVPLTPLGEQEARSAGKVLRQAGLGFDIVLTSVLQRAIRTSQLALEELAPAKAPFAVQDWRLNERHYGALQGLNKAETAAKHGDEKVTLWRRSYDVPPPPLDSSHPFDTSKSPAYATLPKGVLPLTESLKTTGCVGARRVCVCVWGGVCRVARARCACASLGSPAPLSARCACASLARPPT